MWTVTIGGITSNERQAYSPRFWRARFKHARGECCVQDVCMLWEAKLSRITSRQGTKESKVLLG
jgi:hypothetical protein